MTVSLAVHALASPLLRHVAETIPDSPLVPYLEEVARMPQWNKLKRLDEWERLVVQRETAIDERERGEALFCLAESIFELGASNMYGALQSESVRVEYERICAAFRAAGISSDAPDSASFDFGRW